jgi:ABC-type antimicrobial peptide transport system permease subunit
VYVLFAHDRTRARNLVVQGDGIGGDRGRAALALALRHELESYVPGMPLPNVSPWLAGFEGALTMVGFMASLFGAFGLFGLGLCAVGLYGVLAYTVSRRLREFAVRVALGARRRDVARIVVHDAAVTALAGVGIGAFIALSVTRAIAAAMSGLPYATVLALVMAELVLFAAATLAALGPVRQAASANPVEILRAS